MAWMFSVKFCWLSFEALQPIYKLWKNRFSLQNIDGHLVQSMPSGMPSFKFSFSFLQYKALDAL